MKLGRLVITAVAAGGLAAPLGVPGAAAGAAPSAASSWSQARYGPAHDALNAAEAVLSPSTAGKLTTSWSVPVSRRNWVLESNPTVAAGRAYLPTWDGHLVALDAATGAVRWTKRLPGGMFGSAPVDGAGVYTWLSDGTVRAYRTSDGAQRWSVSEPNGGGSPNSSLAEADGVLYGATWTGDVWARRTGTGAEVWRARVSDGDFGTPTVWRDEVLVIGDDNAVHALDRRTGAVLWRTPVHANWDDPPAVGADGSVFLVGNDECSMTALAAVTGAVRWHRTLPGRCLGGGAVAVDGQRVYLATDRDDVLAVDARTGSVIWRRHHAGVAFAGGYWAAPVVAGSVLWIAGGRTLWALDPRTGGQLLARPTHGAFGEPVVVDGRVYTSEADAALHAYTLPSDPARPVVRR